jgi:hypothetical protein
MTLIIGFIAKKIVGTATDNRLTDNSGQPHEDNPKSMKVTTRDADMIISFTGRADLPITAGGKRLPQTTMSWLANFVSAVSPATKTVEEFFAELSSTIEASFQSPYPEEVRALVFLAVGRYKSGERKPLAFKVSNIDLEIDPAYNTEQASPVFKSEKIPLSSNPKLIIVDGWMPATQGSLFVATKAELKNYLSRRDHSQYRDIIRDKALELIQLAAADPQANNMIGERAVCSLLYEDGTIGVKHVPDSGVRSLPGSQNKDIAVTGLTISGNPPGHGEYKVGG